jgi:hypothetical protein
MVDVTEARALAHGALNAYAERLGEALELIPEPEETSRCLVFYWTTVSRKTPSPGVGPIAVERSTGETCFLGSQPIEIALEIAGLA